MTASHNDSFQLAQNGTFQNRVQASLVAACIAITNEGWTVAFHRERQGFASQVLSATGTGQSAFASVFALSCATDANCLADATSGGTVALTSTNSSTAQSQVTDAHIDSAIASQFNGFFRCPAN